MNFERYRAQLKCESFLNCTSLENWFQNQKKFEKYSLTKNDDQNLLRELREDAVDLYYKGLLSLSEGIDSVNSRLYSWATVKLYYSVYYFIRSSLALNGYAIIFNKRTYLLKASVGEKPIKKNNRDYNSTHKGTINHFKDLFGHSDKLQSNKIDGENAYIWLMKRREQVNYNERCFHDPDCSDFWKIISTDITNGKIESVLKKYYNDSKYIYCFQEDHACLALPIKRAILTKQNFDDLKLNINLSPDKIKIIKTLLKIDRNNLFEFNDLIN